MSADPASEAGPDCPRCGRPGAPVRRQTVAGATAAPLPSRQDLFLCRSATCELLYFGSGAEIPIDAATQRPWFKDGGDVACFCFGHRSGEIDEFTIARVTDRVKRRECACDLRNPTGKCCLADLRRLLAGAGAEPP